jgi:hypothetical protein
MIFETTHQQAGEVKVLKGRMASANFKEDQGRYQRGF